MNNIRHGNDLWIGIEDKIANHLQWEVIWRTTSHEVWSKVWVDIHQDVSREVWFFVDNSVRRGVENDIKNGL